MESVESPLEVLSRAATMVQHCRKYSNSENTDDAESVNGNSPCGSNASASPPSSNETVSSGIDAASTKQLSSSKWRRERRCTTRIPDYKNRETNLVGNKALRSQSFNDKSLSKVHLEPISRTRSGDNNLHHSDSDLSNYDDKINSDPDSPTSKKPTSFLSHKNTSSLKPPEYTETPLDMSVKMRSSPPSYSQSISNSLLYRPSVITQATNNSVSTTPTSPPIAAKGSMSMCDPVIDEHFRRSLGADYMSLFGKNKEGNGIANGKTQKVATKDRGSSPIRFPSDPCSKFLNPNATKDTTDSKTAVKEDKSDEEDCKMDVDESEGLTVDDHFAKALGDTWKKLQENIQKPEVSKTSDNIQKNPSFANLDDRKDLANSNHDKKHSRGIVI
ncbi:uncharacterized protein LOC143915450 isoform X2 [Arctopsyche grandis]|uniref:uncharacterized protein LOC143915450 isoform X2 n=1 Tax=Arctopsyche grandis TaxID=121162 RepID=UPI00406D99A5